MNQYPDFEDFYKSYEVDPATMQQFYNFAKQEGIKDTLSFDIQAYIESFWKEHKDTVKQMYTSYEQFKNNHTLQSMLEKYMEDNLKLQEERNKTFDTDAYIKRQIKTLIARRLYPTELSAKIWLDSDDTYNKAIEVIKDKSYFKRFQIKY